jgi:hypothetical protein
VLPGTYCEVHDKPVPTNTMAWRTHECIALGRTGNLQGSVKFYCLTTRRVLKQRLFTPMPMPDRVIKRVNTIGEREGQGRTFRFLNRRKEPYEWPDSVPEDDPEFQGLLDDEEEAAYPKISAKLPGVDLEEEERDFTPVTDEPEADFCKLAGAAHHNAGINADDRIRAALGAAAEHRAPAVIEGDKEELVYKVTFKLPDAGLVPIANDFDVPLGDNRNDTLVAPIVVDDVDAMEDPGARRYPMRARRSAVGGQPYDEFAPRVAFLQLGTTRGHRSVLQAAESARLPKEKWMLATTSSNAAPIIDDTIHRWDEATTTTSKDELKVWGDIMTQYNLKPGLRKFGS